MNSSTFQHTDIAAPQKKSDKLFHRITAGVVIVLLGMTFFQAIEIGRLRGYVQAQEPGGVPAAAASQPANPAPPAANVGLPSQVGGC